MNRRNFLNSIMVAGASFAILPGAGRIWRAERATKIVPYWFQTWRHDRYISPLYVAAYNRLRREHPDFRNLVFEDCATDAYVD